MGDTIRQAMERRNMSIAEFAEAISCSRTNVYSILSRERIDINRLNLITSVLKLKLSDFIDDPPENPKKYIVLVEVEENEMEKLVNEHQFDFIKTWKTK